MSLRARHPYKMLYFKHSELVNKYHVSLKTVHNWIDAAKQGKLSLELYEKGSRTYIANKPSNIETVEKLVEQGKKYRNARFHKTVTPKPEFYDIFSKRQIFDIVSNLTLHREIPRQYNYFNGGALNWDALQRKLYANNKPNNLTNTVELLDTNSHILDSLIGTRKRVNVVDVGIGNAMPTRKLLEHLRNRELLNRYIGIDISESMLDIAENNVKEWFSGALRFERHVRDITFERFDDVLLDDMLDKEADDTVNIVLLLGATPINFRFFKDALSVVYASMSQDDILVYTGKPDTEESRRYFNLINDPTGQTVLSPNYSYMLELLGISKDLYQPEVGYDDIKRMRYVRVRLNMPITINFSYKNISRNVQLNKGDTILLLRVWHMSVSESISQFESIGFTLLQSGLSADRGRFMTVYGVDPHAEYPTDMSY